MLNQVQCTALMGTAVIDTSPEADRILTDLYRKMPAAQKWRKLGELFECAKILSEAGVRLSNPSATAADIRREWLARTIGEAMPQAMRESGHAATR